MDSGSGPAGHPGKTIYGDADLKPDAGQKSDQRGARQEVGEEAQL
jgi:hypothetical protein